VYWDEMLNACKSYLSNEYVFIVDLNDKASHVIAQFVKRH